MSVDHLAALWPYGWSDRWLALYTDEAEPHRQPGRIIRHDGPTVLTALPDGIQSRKLRPSTPSLAVGDWIVTDADVVKSVLPRATLLRRLDTETELEQLLAANVDLVLIVCGLDRPVKTGRIQRAVTQTWDSGAAPVIVLTKTDLADDVDAAIDAAQEGGPGVDVMVVSAVGGDGIDGLATLIDGHTAVLLGESGAGKSTLVNALMGDDIALTGRTRTGDAKGRHTTTARQLHVLPSGGCLIDTPGIRALGLWTDTDQVDDVFEDVSSLAVDCRFRDCQHDREPDCAVRAALQSGELDRERFDAWERLRREARSAELRADEHARRQNDRRFGRLMKEVKEDMKRKGRG